MSVFSTTSARCHSAWPAPLPRPLTLSVHCQRGWYKVVVKPLRRSLGRLGLGSTSLPRPLSASDFSVLPEEDGQGWRLSRPHGLGSSSATGGSPEPAGLSTRGSKCGGEAARRGAGEGAEPAHSASDLPLSHSALTTQRVRKAKTSRN